MEGNYIDFSTGEFVCGSCGRRFPAHYRTKKGMYGRKQFGRGWVAGNNNFFRHTKACLAKVKGGQPQG